MLLSSLAITLYLFYIDEGYYNFKWVFEIGNWAAFAIYIGLIFGCQFILFQLIRRMNRIRSKITWSIIAGTVLALLLAFFVIFN